MTSDRLVHADSEPGNWLTYSRTYDGRRFSPLSEIDRRNVADLALRWVHPIETTEPVETTPLVADGVMYLTRPGNGVTALNATTGQVLWEYDWPEADVKDLLCCGNMNRGVGLLNDTLYMGTVDAHLVAIDTKTGQKRWDVVVADPKRGYTISAAPLAVKGLIVVGTVISQAYWGEKVNGTLPETRGHIDAYDAATGALKWRFYTVPGKGEAGNETWHGDSWRQPGASAWMTGSYDAQLNLLYWGVGNPAASFDGAPRAGDNLYSSSVLALDPDTGRLRWHFQFTPHDTHDWDAAQVFVLADIDIAGQPRRVLLNANRNGFFYALDRETGAFLFARPFAKQTWAKGFDERGRPLVMPGIEPDDRGVVVSPNADGATSWWSPSFSAPNNLFYVTAHDSSETYLAHYRDKPRTFDPVASFLRAIDASTGAQRWQVPLPGRSTAGVLTTAGNLLFTADGKAAFFALDAATGEPLWQDHLAGWIHAAPISYRSGGSQFVAVAASTGIYAFALPRDGVPAPRWGWLQAIAPSRARTAALPGLSSGVRIAIDQSIGDVPWHIQWNVERFVVTANTRYRLRFRARADGTRIIRVAVARVGGDWSSIGLYRELQLGTDWQPFDVEFTASADEARARIHFDLGGDPRSVELAGIELMALPAQGR